MERIPLPSHTGLSFAIIFFEAWRSGLKCRGMVRRAVMGFFEDCWRRWMRIGVRQRRGGRAFAHGCIPGRPALQPHAAMGYLFEETTGQWLGVIKTKDDQRALRSQYSEKRVV